MKNTHLEHLEDNILNGGSQFSARSNKSGFLHKLGQFENLSVKFNAISGFEKR